MSKSKLGWFILFMFLFLTGLALFDPTQYIQENTISAWWIDAIMFGIGLKLINGPPTASA